MPRISIDVEDRAWLERMPDADRLTEETANAVFAAVAGANEAAEVNFLLADDARLQALNRQFRGRDSPTNVLSFPGEPRGSGDIAIALQTVEAEARRDSKSPRDHMRHLVVHGVLHLMGYDHQHDGEAEVMESLETKILLGFGVTDPYVLVDEVP